MEKLILIGTITLVILFIMLLLWLRRKVTLDESNCYRMDNLYKDFPLVRSVNPITPEYGYNLRDYYVKTAYNCCSAGQYKNDFVNICALKNCIRQGARCLDFEIYSVEGKPVIAVSSLNDYSVKESYNSVPFSTAMIVLRDYAFSGSTCPNPADPLILHFRVMSKNQGIYNEMAESLAKVLGPRLLGKNYSYEYNGKNIGMLPLRNFMGKVVICVNKSEPLMNFEGTKLDEYVNIASNAVFMRQIRMYDVKYGPDTEELTEFNRKNMSICLPDLNPNANNINYLLPMKYGVQFVGMCVQNYDGYYEAYQKFFDNAGSAFALKPEHLRYVPVTIEAPPPPAPGLAFATREFKPYPNATDDQTMSI